MQINRYALLVNPNAGGGKAGRIISDIEQFLEQKSILFNVFKTKEPKQATKLAKEIALDKRFDAVIVVSGDGTLNEVIQGLVGSNLPVGYLPMGSGNDFARAANIDFDWKKTLENILQINQPTQVNIGAYRNNQTKENGFFINNFGIGFDAQIAYQTNRSITKPLLGPLTFVVQGPVSFVKQKGFDAVVDGVNYQNIMMLTITNGPYFGGGNKIQPQADIKDWSLDIVIIDKSSIAQLANFFIKMRTDGSHISLKNIHTHHFQKNFHIELKNPQIAHIDGESLTKQLFNLEFGVVQHPFLLDN